MCSTARVRVGAMSTREFNHSKRAFDCIILVVGFDQALNIGARSRWKELGNLQDIRAHKIHGRSIASS